MESEPLTAACELAFAVAREGVEAVPPIDPPASMRSFLYVAQLPRRAITVAHRALEEDPAFRARVAAHATVANVGEEGYAWLHQGSSQPVAPTEKALPPIPTPPAQAAPAAPASHIPPVPPPPATSAAAPTGAVPPVPAPRTPTTNPSSSTPPMPAPPAPSMGGQDSSATSDSSSATSDSSSATSDSIEDELSHLRSLVGRLADERQAVSSSVTDLESEVAGRRNEANELATQLDSLRSELATANASASGAAQRVTELEAQLAAAHRDLSSAQHDLARAQSELASVRGELATATAQLAARSDEQAFEAQRAAGLESRLSESDAVAQQVPLLRQDLADAQNEREDMRARLEVAEQARVDLEEQLSSVSTQWRDLQMELVRIGEQRAEVESELNSLLEERRQSALERSALFSDLGDQLGRVEAERDLLASQLAKVHQHLDGTRAAFEEASESVGSRLSEVESSFAEAERSAETLGATTSAATENVAAIGAAVAGSPDEPAVTEPAKGDPGLEAPTSDDPAEDSDSPAVGSDSPAADNDSPAVGSDELPEAIDPFGVDPEPLVFDDEPPVEQFDATVTPGSASFDLDPNEWMGAGDGAEAALDEASAAETVDTNALTPDDAAVEAAAAEVFEASSGHGRKVIAVPDSISGDSVAVAKHVAGTDDVVLLIDGDAVAELGWPTLTIADRRKALVSYLGDLADNTGAAPDIIFDGSLGEDDALPNSRSVRVRLTASSVTPVAAISELVDSYPREWPVSVVTDNPMLAADAKVRGAFVLDNGQLLDLFI